MTLAAGISHRRRDRQARSAGLLTDAGTVWCARRLADGALTHADTPARLLQHIADADERLPRDQPGRL